MRMFVVTAAGVLMASLLLAQVGLMGTAKSYAAVPLRARDDKPTDKPAVTPPINVTVPTAPEAALPVKPVEEQTIVVSYETEPQEATKKDCCFCTVLGEVLTKWFSTWTTTEAVETVTTQPDTTAPVSVVEPQEVLLPLPVMPKEELTCPAGHCTRSQYSTPVYEGPKPVVLEEVVVEKPVVTEEPVIKDDCPCCAKGFKFELSLKLDLSKGCFEFVVKCNAGETVETPVVTETVAPVIEEVPAVKKDAVTPEDETPVDPVTPIDGPAPVEDPAELIIVVDVEEIIEVKVEILDEFTPPAGAPTTDDEDGDALLAVTAELLMLARVVG